MEKKKLPIGIEDFGDFRRKDYYYIDKTGMIKELLEHCGSVNLFTRPRRFGKSLNMSMLKYFFEIGTDQTLFNDLAISKETKLCEQHMGRYPVISLSLKQVYGLDYQSAENKMRRLIMRENTRFDFLQDSEVLTDRDKECMQSIGRGDFELTDAVLEMSRILYTHYGEKVIILIDEYDVPLQKAEAEGYYREMVNLIGQFFGSSMKTNPYMEFAVVTGCLRISKESIFTGFNNPKMHMIIDKEYDEWFGFTDKEVQEILAYYEQSKYYNITKEWYDGYLFGQEYVYCPWDVVNWVNQLFRNEDNIPRNFWANSSGNQLVYRFAEIADEDTKEQLGLLLEGKSIWKKLDFEITYNEIDESIENLWSVLFMTGYLTFQGRDDGGNFELVLPNREIKNLFKGIVDAWFTNKVIKDEMGLQELVKALESEDAKELEAVLNESLAGSVSYLDGGRLKEKEAFYHGLLLGMLKSRSGWIVRSNREAGDGRLDLVMYRERENSAIIFEVKYTKDYKDLESTAKTALVQIKEKNYDNYFEGWMPEKITHYGIAFCRKRCKVLKAFA